jgi:hypothetical protein
MDIRLKEIEGSINNWTCNQYKIPLYMDTEDTQPLDVPLEMVLKGSNSFPNGCYLGKRLWLPAELNASDEVHRKEVVLPLFAKEAQKHGFRAVNRGWDSKKGCMRVVCQRGVQYKVTKVSRILYYYILLNMISSILSYIISCRIFSTLLSAHDMISKKINVGILHDIFVLRHMII